MLTATNGAKVALAQLATIRFIEGQTTITREMNKRQLIVRLNLRGRDLYQFHQRSAKRVSPKTLTMTKHVIKLVGEVSLKISNERRQGWRLLFLMLLGLMFVLLVFTIWKFAPAWLNTSSRAPCHVWVG